MKEKANKLNNEIREVEELDNWQPAIPLIHSLYSAGEFRNLQRIAEKLEASPEEQAFERLLHGDEKRLSLSRSGWCALPQVVPWADSMVALHRLSVLVENS